MEVVACQVEVKITVPAFIRGSKYKSLVYDLSKSQIRTIDNLRIRIEEHLKAEEAMNGRAWDEPHKSPEETIGGKKSKPKQVKRRRRNQRRSQEKEDVTRDIMTENLAGTKTTIT